MPIFLYVFLTNKEKWPTWFRRVVIHIAVYCKNYMAKVAILLLDVSDDMVDTVCVLHLDGLCHLLSQNLWKCALPEIKQKANSFVKMTMYFTYINFIVSSVLNLTFCLDNIFHSWQFKTTFAVFQMNCWRKKQHFFTSYWLTDLKHLYTVSLEHVIFVIN